MGNPECFVCGSNTARISLRGFAEWKINEFAKTCLQGGLGAHRPALYLNGSCIFDPEYTEASEEAEEEGLHPEWTLSEWDVSSGTLLQVEDEGQGFSCNIVVSDEPDMEEEAFPAGFRVEAKAEGGAEKRKAEEAAAEPAAKRQEPT